MTERIIVAVDTRGTPQYQKFILESFKRIAAQQPQHSFIFLSDKPLDPSFKFSKNITPLEVKPSKISLLNKLKISSLLKKYKASVFVTAQLINTNIPQCLIAIDKLSSKSLVRANVIVTTSLFSKKEIAEKYKIEKNKIDVVYHGVDENFQPIQIDEREKIKERYADGNEYFLCLADDKSHDLLNLLKAFSVFKKMQKSSMQLVIISKQEACKEFLEMLRLYKFKSEVKVLENRSDKEFASISAATYAFVYPFADYVHGLNSIMAGVPVVINGTGSMQEIFGNAALYFDGSDHTSIADKMMLIFKDEKLRKHLIEKGIEQVQKYSWLNTSNSLWKSIEKAGG